MKREDFEKQLRKDPKYRKAEYDLQWDTPFMSSRILTALILKSGLTRSQIIRRAKLTHPSLSRAEYQGCQLSYLNRVAKVCGMALEIEIVKADVLVE